MKKILRAIARKIKSLSLGAKERRHGLVGQPKLWKIKRDFQLNYLTSIGLTPNDYLLDIGCGTLRGGIPLIAYLDKGHYFGIESRGFVLEEAKEELKEHQLEHKQPVLIFSKDLGILELNARFGCIWAFSVMIHLNDEIAEKCLSLVSKHLKREGNYYANVKIGEAAEGNWEGFPVVRRNFEFYEMMAAKYNLKVEDVGDLKFLGHNTGIEKHDRQRMLKFSFAKAGSLAN